MTNALLAVDNPTLALLLQSERKARTLPKGLSLALVEQLQEHIPESLIYFIDDRTAVVGTQAYQISVEDIELGDVDLFISVDCELLREVQYLGKPIIALLGPTQPPVEVEEIIQTDFCDEMPCWSTCETADLPAPCMRRIDLEKVAKTAKKTLQETREYTTKYQRLLSAVISKQRKFGKAVVEKKRAGTVEDGASRPRVEEYYKPMIAVWAPVESETPHGRLVLTICERLSLFFKVLLISPSVVEDCPSSVKLMTPTEANGHLSAFFHLYFVGDSEEYLFVLETALLSSGQFVFLLVDNPVALQLPGDVLKLVTVRHTLLAYSKEICNEVENCKRVPFSLDMDLNGSASKVTRRKALRKTQLSITPYIYKSLCAEKVKRIALLQPLGIGDIFFLEPVIRGLRRIYNEPQIDLYALPEYIEIMDGYQVNLISEGCVYNEWGRDFGGRLGRYPQKRLGKKFDGYDMVLNYRGRDYQWLYDHLPATTSYQELACGYAGVPFELPELRTKAEAPAILETEKRNVLIHIKTGKDATYNLSVKKATAIMEKNAQVHFILIGGGEYENVKMPENCTNTSGKLSLPEVKALCREADGTVLVDSFLLHLANAAEIPTLLFHKQEPPPAPFSLERTLPKRLRERQNLTIVEMEEQVKKLEVYLGFNR